MPDWAREATVVAAIPLRLLAVHAPALERWLAAHPEARGALSASAEDRLEARFLATGGHFARFDHDRLRQLSTRLEPRLVAAGTVIVREGGRGDRCYLLRAGRVELLCAESSPVDSGGQPSAG